MEASGITHHHIVSRIGCGLYYFILREMLQYADPAKKKSNGSLRKTVADGLHHGFAYFDHEPDLYDDALSRYSRLRIPSEFQTLPENVFASSGYVVHTLEAAVWSLLTTNGLEAALLRAVNLGDDTDTVGAVTGGLAGTWYGYSAIPESWLKALARRDWMTDICSSFVNSLPFKAVSL